MRLFVAVELSEEARGHLIGVQRRILAGLQRSHYVGGDYTAVRWVAPENLHVTVKFLGEVADSEVEPLTRELSRVPFDGASLVVDHGVCLPAKGPVWIVAAGLGGEAAALERLHLRLEDAGGVLGFRREGRKYLPHVTIGRTQRERNGRTREVPRHRFMADQAA